MHLINNSQKKFTCKPTRNITWKTFISTMKITVIAWQQRVLVLFILFDCFNADDLQICIRDNGRGRHFKAAVPGKSLNTLVRQISDGFNGFA